MNRKFKIIYADPPWSFKNVNTGGSLKSGSSAVYPVMSLARICALPVKTICDDDCILFMWWVASQPQEALDVVKAWGFTLKTMSGFDWMKLTKHGKPYFGMGFWTRAGSEDCLIATRGKPVRANASVRSCFSASVGRHSEKPACVRDMIVQLCGDLPRIELFARERVLGWSCWGNEVESDIWK